MKGSIFFCSIVALVSAKPGGYYHQEHSYKSSSSSFKNNELQHQNEDEGFYSKDGDIEGRMKPKVNSHNQHSEYTNPKLLSGSSTNLATGGFNGATANQANFDRVFGANLNGYHATGSNGAVDGFASTDRVMDLSNVYTSGSHGTSHGSYGTSMGYGANSGGYGTNSLGYGTNSGGYGTSSGGYGTNSGGYGTSSGGYGVNTGGYGASSGGYGSSSGGYGVSSGSNLGGYGRTHENYDTSRVGTNGNALVGTSNFGYTQGGSRYGYVQHGSSSGSNLNSVVQRLQEDMSRQLQNAVSNQYRSSGYTTSVSSSQMTADIRALEDELKRNLTRQLQESLRSQYGQQELRGSDSYSVVEGRPSTVVNYRNQELADLTGQLENNLLKQLHQNVRTTYNSYTSSNNMYQPTYISSSTYRPIHYTRPVIVAPSNLRFTPIANPDSITQIASKIQSNVNIYLDNALQNIYSTYLQSGRNTYTLTDFDNEVNRIRDQIIRNLTMNLDDQVRRNYGQQILKNDHYYSVSATGETSSQHNYSIRDYESLKKQVEENLLKKLNQTATTYRDQYQRQMQQSYSSSTDYYTATFRPVYYTSGNQIYDYSDLQRQLSEQLQNALNKHKYSHSSSYSTSYNPQAYQISLDELTRELQRNLTEQLSNYRVQSSSSNYGYTSGSSGGSTDFESMKNQLQNQLMQQLQQGLQKQQSYSASASYSASSSSSSNANYGTHQSYANYPNSYPSNRYKRDISLYGPREGHHYSYKSSKSSRSYTTNSQFSSQEQNREMNFRPHTHDLQPLVFTHSKRTEENSPEIVEDVTNHHQVESPQKFVMPTGDQLAFRGRHDWRQRFEIPRFHNNFDGKKFTDQELTEQQVNDDSGQHSGTRGHYGHSQYRAANEFRVSGHMMPHHSQFSGQEAGDYSVPNQDIEDQQLTGQSEDDFTQQLQTTYPQKHFKYTLKHQLPEPISIENLNHNIDLNDLRRPKQSTYQQSPEMHLEDHEDFTQQLEQQVQKLNQAYPVAQQQTDDDLTTQKPELYHEPKLQISDQQLEDQDELPKDLEVSDSQQVSERIPEYGQETQQVEEEPLLKLSKGRSDGSSKFEFTRQLDQNQDDLTQQLEEERSYGHKYPQPIEVQPVEDVSNQQSQEQDDLTLQQAQDDLTQQMQLTDIRNPKDKPQNNQEQELEQQSETAAEYSNGSKILNQESEQQLEDQNDLTQQLEVEGKPKPVQSTETDLSQQLELTANSKPVVENLIPEEQFEDQDNSNQILLTTERENKPTYDQSQEQQSEDMAQQLVLSNDPKSNDRKPKYIQEQEQAVQREDDFNQQTELHDIQYQKNIDHDQKMNTLDQQITDQEIQKPYNTQQQEQDYTLEPNNRKIESKNQDQSENDLTQQLELTDFHKSKTIKPIHEQEQVEYDSDQKLELTHSQKPDQLDQQIQEQNQNVYSKTPNGTAPKYIHDEQLEGQQLETNRKPNNSPKPLRELENVLDQKLELTGIRKYPKTESRDEEQQQTQLTGTDQTESTRNQQNKQVLPEVVVPVPENKLELTNAAPMHITPSQKHTGQHTDFNTQQEVSNGHFSHHLRPNEHSEDNFKQHPESSTSRHHISTHTHIAQSTNPTTVTYRKPESHSVTYLHSSSSERPFANSHSGYGTSSATGNSYEEAIRQQDALLDVLKQRIEAQSNNQGTYEQRTIKKATYMNGNPVGTTEQTQFINSNGKIIRNEPILPMNVNTFTDSRAHGQIETYGHNHEDIPSRTISNAGNNERETGYHVNGNSPIGSTGYINWTPFKGTLSAGNTITRDFTSNQFGQEFNGNIMQGRQFAPIKVADLVNKKPVQIMQSNSQIVESQPLIDHILRKHQLAQGKITDQVSQSMENDFQAVGSGTNDDHFGQTEGGNVMSGGQFTRRTTRRVIHFVNGKPVSATEYIRIVQPNGKIVESKHDIPLTEDLLKQHQFPQEPTPGHLLQNMEHFGQVEGTHYIPSTENLLRHGQFSDRLPGDQFSRDMGHYSQSDGLSSTSNHFGQNVNVFGTSGFTGRKKTSYYVNGKLVGSSESKQFIGPDGEVIETNSGSPSAVGTIEKQIADQQNTYGGQQLHNTSRYSLKTSRYTSRTGY